MRQRVTGGESVLEAPGETTCQQAPLEGQHGTLPGISVIVPVRNGKAHLARCLEALSRSEYLNFEVIVVDDCSTDDTSQIVTRYGARYLLTPRVLGPGAARNLGAKHAHGQILAFVDADVLLPPDALRLIADDFCSDPRLAAVFGSYDDEPAWPSFISQYKNLMHHYVHQNSNESASTFWAGCGAIRRVVFEEFGGFDGATYVTPSIEDIALGLDLARCGYRIRLDKRLRVKHLKRWTLRGLLRADVLYRAVPWAFLILKRGQVPRDLNLTYASRASSALVGLLFLAFALQPLSLAGAIRIPPLLTMAFIASITLLLLLLNWDVYRFFKRKRGWWFAARAVPMHWLYYLYSGGTFFVCAVIHLFHSPAPFPPRANVPE
jgi:glycosyltransferase involved in cell wall biosynthesis